MNYTGDTSISFINQLLIFPGFVLIVILIFFPVFKNGFVMDDFWWLDNANTWKENPIQSIFLKGDIAFFEPVTNMFWFLGYKFFILNPGKYYSITMLLQVVVALVLAKTMTVLLKSWIPAYLTAGIFLMYPCHFEAGYYLSAVDTLFQTLFYVVTVWMYLKYLNGSKKIFYIFIDCFFGFRSVCPEIYCT